MTADVVSLSADDFIANVAVVASRFDSATYPQENLPPDDWSLLLGAGVLLPTLPKQFGGRDSHVEMCRVVEALSEWNLPLGMYVTVITTVALRPIALRGSAEAKQEMLPLFAATDPMIAGFASTEPRPGRGNRGQERPGI